MLASITPLGERSRHGKWGVTVTAFLIGSGVTGALVGALAGGAGRLLIPASVGAHPRLAALALAALVALALDASGAVPGPGRQVNERWLQEYRGWVYGLGYGAQLGAGVVTVVTSAATYVALLAALLSGGGGRGAVIVGLYGLVRGVTPLAAAGVRGPAQLVALHRALGRSRVPAARGGLLALAAVLAVSLAGSIG
jgi:hypothetical protein